MSKLSQVQEIIKLLELWQKDCPHLIHLSSVNSNYVFIKIEMTREEEE